VQKSKQSDFAWIITHETRALWQGIRLAPGDKEDMYLGQAETNLSEVLYGQLWAWFILQVTATLLCDNLGVITNLTKLLTPNIPWPNNTTNDDWDS